MDKDITSAVSPRFNIKFSFICNITEGSISLFSSKINILFGNNGIGKSSIVKSLYYDIMGQQDNLIGLKKYYSDLFDTPKVEFQSFGAAKFSSCLLFDENYVNNFLFKENDVANNTYEIIASTKEIENGKNALTPLFNQIINALSSEPITKYCDLFEKSIENYGIGKALATSTDLDKRTALAKLQKADSVNDVFNGQSVVGYKPYLLKAPTEYPKWMAKGKDYITKDTIHKDLDICPFCLSKVQGLSTMVESFAAEVKTKTVDGALNKEKFYSLLSEADTNQAALVSSLRSSSTLSANDLKKIEGPYSKLKKEYEKITAMRSFDVLAKGLNASNISSYFSNQKLDVELIGKAIPEKGKEAAISVNNAIDALLSKAGEIDEKMANLNQILQNRIHEKEEFLNDFLKDAGIPYYFRISSDDKTIGTLLKPVGNGNIVPESIKDHLSFGEKNVISCILFALEAAASPKDSLIIFDDPLSSFDANKKYALLYHLFNTADNDADIHGVFEDLSEKTILIVTHDFEIVTYAFNSRLGRKRKKVMSVNFGFMKGGLFSEKQITEDSLITDFQYCKKGFAKSASLFSRLIYLRKSIYLESDPARLFDDVTYQVISNLLKRRPANCTIRFASEDSGNQSLEKSALLEGVKRIVTDLNLPSSTTYEDLLAQLSDEKLLKDSKTFTDYEKLMCIRILGDSGGCDKDLATKMGPMPAVFWKAANECYHIENDSLYMLDSSAYPTMPEFLVNICDDLLKQAYSLVIGPRQPAS